MTKRLKASIRKDFPIFQNNPDLIYLDSTATALKPRMVIEALKGYYESYSANVFRGLYPISEKATAAFENSRQIVAKFLKAERPEEVIFVRNTTEALNLLAYTLARQEVQKGDEIITSVVEHHANFVPWQQFALENEAVLKVLEPDERGVIPLDNKEYAESIISAKTKIVALFGVSNVLGTINPLKKIIKNVREINPHVIIIVDGAQMVPSLEVNVKDLDCDFFAFSGHKALGPTGVGVLWGKYQWLERIPPFHYGGEMIKEVKLEESTFQDPPFKFEAGTPAIGEVIALGEALEYLSQFDKEEILKHERHLWELTYRELKKNSHVHLLGPEEVENRTGILAFVHDKIHAHDLSQILAEDNVCIRAGHHCAMPLHTYFQIEASARASFYIYNTEKDVEALLRSLNRAEKLFLR